MKGKLLSINFVTLVAQKGENRGKKFSLMKFKVEVEVNSSKREIKTYDGSMSVEYARKYFAYCNLTSKDAIGKPVEVTLRSRKFTAQDGVERTFTEVKYLNFLDESGDPIRLPKDDTENAPF